MTGSFDCIGRLQAMMARLPTRLKTGTRIRTSSFSIRFIELCIAFVLTGMLNSPLIAAPKNLGGMIATNGAAASVIVVGNHASSSDRFVASELQRYIEMLSGAKVAVITPD